MRVARLRSLGARVGGFAFVCAVIVVVAHAFVMPRLGRAGLHGRFAREQRAIAAALTGVRDPAALQAAVVRVADARGGGVAVVDRGGAVIARAGDVDGDHVAFPLDDGAVLLLRGADPSIPGGALVATAAIMLLMIAVASLWFARSLARPLGRLAIAARRLGAGDLTARADVRRGDELGQVAGAFDDMAARIGALLDANRALIASVSHELRTPLARIRVALELADESPAEAQELLGGIAGDLTELEQLVEDILTMTRLATRGAPPLRTERCAAGDLADRAARRWQQVHGGHELICEVADAGAAIDGDPVLLRRVLDNLLDNAIRHGGAGQPVTLRVAADAGAVRFEVVDRGAGLAADELAHVFTPFWRSDSSRTRDTGGVGLGLALAREIARAHGGDVTLDSAPGSGTRAVLRLPGGA